MVTEGLLPASFVSCVRFGLISANRIEAAALEAGRNLGKNQRVAVWLVIKPGQPSDLVLSTLERQRRDKLQCGKIFAARTSSNKAGIRSARPKRRRIDVSRVAPVVSVAQASHRCQRFAQGNFDLAKDRLAIASHLAHKIAEERSRGRAASGGERRLTKNEAGQQKAAFTVQLFLEVESADLIGGPPDFAIDPQFMALCRCFVLEPERLVNNRKRQAISGIPRKFPISSSIGDRSIITDFISDLSAKGPSFFANMANAIVRRSIVVWVNLS